MRSDSLLSPIFIPEFAIRFRRHLTKPDAGHIRVSHPSPADGRLSPFFSTPASSFYAASDRLNADIAQLSTEQFYTRLSALIAMLKDGHTRLWLSGTAGSALGFTQLPLQFRCFADRIWVTAAPLSHPDLNRTR
jgi:hypothetical protein